MRVRRINTGHGSLEDSIAVNYILIGGKKKDCFLGKEGETANNKRRMEGKITWSTTA